MARILIATDAWHPQVSGVVRTLDTTARVLREWGHAVEVVEPTAYPSVPTYAASHGCIRMMARDAPLMFSFATYGTPVDVVREVA